MGFKGIDHSTNPSMEKSMNSIIRAIIKQNNQFITVTDRPYGAISGSA
jgi:hypothetical protein